MNETKEILELIDVLELMLSSEYLCSDGHIIDCEDPTNETTGCECIGPRAMRAIKNARLVIEK